MTIDNIQKQIKSLQQKMDVWPTDSIKAMDDRNEILALTESHFHEVETDLQKLLEQCKMLPVSEQGSVTPSLKELKTFVQNKFVSAEKELVEIKSQMNHGRHHVKAIRAYTKAKAKQLNLQLSRHRSSRVQPTQAL